MKKNIFLWRDPDVYKRERPAIQVRQRGMLFTILPDKQAHSRQYQASKTISSFTFRFFRLVNRSLILSTT